MDNNFQQPAEHVHYQQQYLNYAYQVMQKNCQFSNNIPLLQHHQQANCTQFTSYNTNTTALGNGINNVNINQTQSLSHCNLPSQNSMDACNNSNNGINSKQNIIYRQQNNNFNSQQISYNSNSSLYVDGSQYWNTNCNQNQQYQQSQHYIGHSLHPQHQSLVMNQCINKNSQSSPLPTISYPNYLNDFDNQNPDYLMNDFTNRIQFPTNNSKHLQFEHENVQIGLEKCIVLQITLKNCKILFLILADFTLKQEQITPTKIIPKRLVKESEFINNFISTSPTTVDCATTSIKTAPYLYNQNLNDSGFNSNPSSVESVFSSKQSSLSEISSNFEDQNEFENSNSSNSNNSIESNIKSLSIKETTLTVNNDETSLNLFICWMDNDESQLNDIELEMREILKQQIALNLCILSNRSSYKIK